MADVAQTRVQHAVEEMLEKLEKEKLRPLLRSSHLAAAKCCENELSSKEQLDQCMKRSFMPAQQVQEVTSQELSQFQARLNRCAQGCQDEAKDRLSVNPTQNDINVAEGYMNTCITNCCDSHIDLIPKIMRRMQQAMDQVKP